MHALAGDLSGYRLYVHAVHFQEQLREEMSRIRAPQMAPYLSLVAEFCNNLKSDVWLWKRPNLLKARLVAKFGKVALSEHERR
jgi:hypothetical protein